MSTIPEEWPFDPALIWTGAQDYHQHAIPLLDGSYDDATPGGWNR